MQTFNNGKKVFFLYPTRDFSIQVIQQLYRRGYETYILNTSEKLEALFRTYEDSLVFINNDYPYENMKIEDFSDSVSSIGVQVYSFFKESVNYAESIKDYISLDQDEDALLEQVQTLLDEAEAHGKREFVRYGSFQEILSEIDFQVDGQAYSVNMHDISPKALSFSSEKDLTSLIGQKLQDIRLTVGAYEIKVNGTLESSRTMGGKEIYVIVFEADEQIREDTFNFIFTSLEKKMDEVLQGLT